MSERITVRRSQTLTPYGVGAILDVLGESFVLMDTRHWRPLDRIRLDRLAQAIGGIDEFAMAVEAPPPPERFKKGLPLLRFPSWHFCPRCRRMVKWKTSDESGIGTDVPRCTSDECPRRRERAQFVPMRFVGVCLNGHLQDIDWKWWAHSESKGPRCGSEDLQFNRTVGAGLSALVVSCRKCPAERSLGQITKQPMICGGRQPWQGRDEEPEVGCQEPLKAVQRGASNVHFSDVASALDIPPWDKDAGGEAAEAIRRDVLFAALMMAVEFRNTRRANKLAGLIADDQGVPPDRVLSVAALDVTGATKPSTNAGGLEQLRLDEWDAFKSEYRDDRRRPFRSREWAVVGSGSTDPVSSAIESLVSRVLVAERLREVRAMTGFRRLKPSGEPVKPDLRGSQKWLPGIEVYGEGVLLTLNPEALRSWETQGSVRSRASKIEHHRADPDGFGQRLPAASPRFIVLHTLSHLLIRQMSFDAGYSSASLRERLYVKESTDRPMAGTLIYTAAGDSEGTLGGLARLGETGRLADLLLRALSSARWCSSDPVCAESEGQGRESLNLAGCHACSLVSETSCEVFNSLLDRTLLLGTPDAPELGYFRPVIDALDQTV